MRKTSERGYDYKHKEERKRWQPIVDKGQAYCQARHCLMRTRWIPPDTPWDLGHTTDRTAYTGPEHQKCNRTDGGRRAWTKTKAPKIRRELPPIKTEREW